ncbi:MAG TPA: protein-methionine-sulfoxide reductase catalytic subunit MsrP [Bryobacteraceae bacterium]|nr:protein-methionine-sulfoxide reductase catalytic subunit MsrP [Bryobacteraceae bacterium]
MAYREVTPKSLYMSRRALMSAAGGALFAGLAQSGQKLSGYGKSRFSTPEKPTPYASVTTYNNFFEFGSAKDDPVVNAKGFKTSPWSVVVDGEVSKPRKLDLDAVLKLVPLEERIYRLRCVEGWSMVVPWIGFELNALIKTVEPTSKAKYVVFETYFDKRQMPESGGTGLSFPYIEGLRMDEALNPLTIIAVGLYGEVLPNQNGAPLRLVVPWKYGFKSAKSLARIRFVEKQPRTTWMAANSGEYGFYANVNPEVDHPRWSQARERRLGEFTKRPTLKFNGYGDQVSALYSGMDLRRYY